MPDWILRPKYEKNIYGECILDELELTIGQVYEHVEEVILQWADPLLKSGCGIYGCSRISKKISFP